MTEDDLKKFLDENKDAVLAASRTAILEKIKDSMKWSLPDSVHQTVNEFLAKEIAPEVGKMLMDQKGAILDAARKSAAALSDELAKRMMEKVTKELDGHRAQEVFKALLGVSSRY